MPDRLLRFRWFRHWSIPIAAALIIIAILAAGLALERQQTLGRQSRDDLCAAINKNRHIMREILQGSLSNIRTYPPSPGRAAAIRLLRHDLILAAPTNCTRLTGGQS